MIVSNRKVGQSISESPPRCSFFPQHQAATSLGFCLANGKAIRKYISVIISLTRLAMLFRSSLRHTILLPLWISQKSTALMADKHTKRFVSYSKLNFPGTCAEYHSDSALCLRVFGEDFTPSGKEEHLKKQKKNNEDIIGDAGGMISVEV